MVDILPRCNILNVEWEKNVKLFSMMRLAQKPLIKPSQGVSLLAKYTSLWDFSAWQCLIPSSSYWNCSHPYTACSIPPQMLRTALIHNRCKCLENIQLLCWNQTREAWYWLQIYEQTRVINKNSHNMTNASRCLGMQVLKVYFLSQWLQFTNWFYPTRIEPTIWWHVTW